MMPSDFSALRALKIRKNMSCPTNEPYVDFSVLRTLKIDVNI